MLNTMTYSASAVVSVTPGIASAIHGNRTRRAAPISRKVFLRPMKVLKCPAPTAAKITTTLEIIMMKPAVFPGVWLTTLRKVGRKPEVR